MTDTAQETGERNKANEVSRREFHRRSVCKQPVEEDQYSLPNAGTDATTGPFVDESSSSSSVFSRNDIRSAARTSSSSMSWPPLDSPIDEEVLFPSPWRDEYYMVDGKTSGFYPGRGDQPVKALWHRVDDNGSNRRSLGSNWPSLNRVHHVSELMAPMAPMTPSRPYHPQARVGRGRGEREGVDGYFQRCHAQARHLG